MHDQTTIRRATPPTPTHRRSHSALFPISRRHYQCITISKTGKRQQRCKSIRSEGGGGGGASRRPHTITNVLVYSVYCAHACSNTETVIAANNGNGGRDECGVHTTIHQFTKSWNALLFPLISFRGLENTRISAADSRTYSTAVHKAISRLQVHLPSSYYFQSGFTQCNRSAGPLARMQIIWWIGSPW